MVLAWTERLEQRALFASNLLNAYLDHLTIQLVTEPCFPPWHVFQRLHAVALRQRGATRTFTKVTLLSRIHLTSTNQFPGTRQAVLPGGLRTGAPGKHVVKGKAKYRLVDEKVRYFVAPPIQDIVSSPVSTPKLFVKL